MAAPNRHRIPDNDINNDDNGTTIGAVVRSAPVTLATGAEPTTDGDADPNSNLSVDFGFVPTGVLSLGNLVWLDLNNNGRVDPGEPGLAGVTVRLIASDGVTVLGTTATNGSGLYQFSGLQPGTYLVEVDRTSVAITGYLSSTDIATSANPNNDINDDDNGVALTSTTVRSGPVVLSALGEPIDDGDTDANSNLSVDFGFVRALSLGNLVWADLNDNGRVDPGEQGIAGVTVRLIGSDGVTVLASTTTDASGRYLFGGLGPAGYYVEVVPPPGTRSSTDIATSADPNTDVDNDDNGVTVTAGAVRSGLVTLAPGAEPITDGDGNPDSNLSVDFGFVPQVGGIDADLCLLQTVPPVALQGGQVSFIYRATNRGPGPAIDVVIEGMVPAGTTLVSAVPSAGGACTLVNGTLDCRWPGATMPGPASDRTVTVVFQVNSGTPVGSTIWAWFMTTSANPDPYPSNNFADGYVFVTDGATTAVDLVLDGHGHVCVRLRNGSGGAHQRAGLGPIHGDQLRCRGGGRPVRARPRRDWGGDGDVRQCVARRGGGERARVRRLGHRRYRAGGSRGDRFDARASHLDGRQVERGARDRHGARPERRQRLHRDRSRRRGRRARERSVGHDGECRRGVRCGDCHRRRRR